MKKEIFLTFVVFFLKFEIIQKHLFLFIYLFQLRDSFIVLVVLCFGTEFTKSLKIAINKVKDLQSSQDFERPEHIVFIF